MHSESIPGGTGVDQLAINSDTWYWPSRL
jgi:hypothetical protein